MIEILSIQINLYSFPHYYQLTWNQLSQSFYIHQNIDLASIPLDCDKTYSV